MWKPSSKGLRISVILIVSISQFMMLWMLSMYRLGWGYKPETETMEVFQILSSGLLTTTMLTQALWTLRLLVNIEGTSKVKLLPRMLYASVVAILFLLLYLMHLADYSLSELSGSSILRFIDVVGLTIAVFQSSLLGKYYSRNCTSFSR